MSRGVAEGCLLMGQPTPHLPPHTPEAGKYLPCGQQLGGSRRPLCVVPPRWVAVSAVWEESEPGHSTKFRFEGAVWGGTGVKPEPHTPTLGV